MPKSVAKLNAPPMTASGQRAIVSTGRKSLLMCSALVASVARRNVSSAPVLDEARFLSEAVAADPNPKAPAQLRRAGPLARRSLHAAREAGAMSSSTLITLEMGLVIVLVLGFGFWELYNLRRDKRK